MKAEAPPLRFPVERGLLFSILIDGIEWAARGNWAQIDKYPAWEDIEKRLADPLKGVPDDEVLVRICDDEDGMARAEERPMVEVTFATLEAATQWAVIHYNHILQFTVRNGLVEDIDYDAVGADVILQKATLGEVIYG